MTDEEIIHEGYINAYALLVGACDIEDLGQEFYLPIDPENVGNLIAYFESIEDYEKCQDLKALNE